MLTGELNADGDQHGRGRPVYSSNMRAVFWGGIMSTGQIFGLRFAVKPTSSILTTRKTITNSGEDTEISSPRVARSVRGFPRRARWASDDAPVVCWIICCCHRGQFGENQGVMA